MTVRMAWPGRLLLALGSVSLLAFAAACSKPASNVAPSGTINVLGPVPAFEPNALPLDWVIEGKAGRGQLTVVERAGVPALKVINGQRSFVAVKPTRASLLATPYLSWAWNMDPQSSGVHPVRLVVGFHGGNPKSRGLGGAALDWPGDTLPPHDRAVVITWGESALQRGSITKPKSSTGRQAASRYTARGGRENTGSWWLETVDLSDIYRRAWPEDDAGLSRITFIGIAAAAGKPPSAAYISGLRLSR